MRRPLIAGNWKMHTTRAEAETLAKGIREQTAGLSHADVLVCPPFAYLQAVGQCLMNSSVAWGAQNLYFEPLGAFTGEVSAAMLADLGCQYVIVGHSERRHILGETNEIVARKVHAALLAELQPILCVGETLGQREAGETQPVLRAQLESGMEGVTPAQFPRLIVAYEPVWAIGTGRHAMPQQADEAQAYLRKLVASRYNNLLADRLRILYGGSVKPDNAALLLGQPNVDGALVGGASLKVDSFVSIVAAAEKRNQRDVVLVG